MPYPKPNESDSSDQSKNRIEVDLDKRECNSEEKKIAKDVITLQQLHNDILELQGKPPFTLNYQPWQNAIVFVTREIHDASTQVRKILGDLDLLQAQIKKEQIPVVSFTGAHLTKWQEFTTQVSPILTNLENCKAPGKESEFVGYLQSFFDVINDHQIFDSLTNILAMAEELNHATTDVQHDNTLDLSDHKKALNENLEKLKKEYEVFGIIYNNREQILRIAKEDSKKI